MSENEEQIDEKVEESPEEVEPSEEDSAESEDLEFFFAASAIKSYEHFKSQGRDQVDC